MAQQPQDDFKPQEPNQPSASPLARAANPEFSSTDATSESGVSNGNSANGNSANHGNGDNGNGHGANGQALSVDDPRTRALLEQLLQSVGQDAEEVREKSSRGGLPDVLGMMRRRWKPVGVLFCLILAAVAWKLRPGEVSYVATATMLLPKAASATSDIGALSGLGGRRDTAGSALDTQIAILQSYPFVEKSRNQAKIVLKQKALKENAPHKYDAALAEVNNSVLKAAAPLSPELVDITITSPSRDAATVMANASIDVYARDIVSQSNTSQINDKRFVAQKVKEVNAQLQKAKNQLKNFKDANHVFDITSALARSSTTIESLEQKERALRIDAEAGATGSTVLSDGITQSLQQRATDARLKYETILRDFFPSSPEARAAEADWRTAQTQVDNRIAQLVRQARQQAQDAARELNEARSNAARLPAIEFRLSQLQDNVAQLSATYQTLTNRYTSLSLTGSAKAATAVNQVPAREAGVVSRTWSRAIFTGLLCAIVMAALCMLLLEQLDHSLHGVEDLEPLLPASILGAMPLLKGRSERRLAQMTGAQPMAPQVLEACRIIRSNLAFSTMDAPAQTILISSADPGEGKSLSALNLATVMAFDGRRVLLLDCDLRRPSQHTLNGLPLEPGFTNVLGKETGFDSAVHQTNTNNLWVMTAGTLPLNPPELLGSRDARQWLQSFKEQFDIIVIDSPPVLALTDAQVLCSQVDGVVMVVAADSTPKSDVQRAQAMLRHAGGRLLGAIFNKVRKSNASTGYYAYGPTYGPNLLARDRQLGESVGTLSGRH